MTIESASETVRDLRITTKKQAGYCQCITLDMALTKHRVPSEMYSRFYGAQSDTSLGAEGIQKLYDDLLESVWGKGLKYFDVVTEYKVSEPVQLREIIRKMREENRISSVFITTEEGVLHAEAFKIHKHLEGGESLVHIHEALIDPRSKDSIRGGLSVFETEDECVDYFMSKISDPNYPNVILWPAEN